MRDVSVMIFFGFGYLMTFLRRAGYHINGVSIAESCRRYSAVGYTLFTAAIAVQWSILCQIVAEESTPVCPLLDALSDHNASLRSATPLAPIKS